MAGMEKRKAQRKKVAPKIGLSGSSGSGKTYSSLRMAYGYCEDWSKICLVDTEGGRGELYSDTSIKGINIGEYDYIRLDPPFTPKRYIEAIHLAESDPNIEIIVLDSMSHAWAGSGGELDMKDAFSQGSKENSFTAWRKVTPEHNNLVETILRSRCTIFATLRTKTEYVIEDQGGKKVPRKIGMAPVFRDGFEYEMTVFFDMSQEHYANATKDNTGIFDGAPFKVTEDHGKMLREWLENGADIPIPATPASKEQIVDLCKTKPFSKAGLEKLLTEHEATWGKMTEAVAQEIIKYIQEYEVDAPADQPSLALAISDKTMKAIHARAKDIDMSHDDLHDFAQTEYKVESLTELTEEQAKEMLDTLKELPERQEGQGV